MRLPLTAVQRRLAVALGTTLAPAAEFPEETPHAGWAAVAVVVAPDPDAVLLIHRAERAGDPWSGHIGLPGGRHDPADADLGATAMRETREEVGLALDPRNLLGRLDDVWPRTPLPRVIVVRPYVYAIDHRPPLTLSDEVATAFWVPLANLREPGTHRNATVTLRGEERIYPGYHLGPHLVWGLTERILTAMLTHL